MSPLTQADLIALDLTPPDTTPISAPTAQAEVQERERGLRDAESSVLYSRACPRLVLPIKNTSLTL